MRSHIYIYYLLYFTLLYFVDFLHVSFVRYLVSDVIYLGNLRILSNKKNNRLKFACVSTVPCCGTISGFLQRIVETHTFKTYQEC